MTGVDHGVGRDAFSRQHPGIVKSMGRGSPLADLGPRLLSGFVLVLFALLSIWVGGIWFAAFVSLAAAVMVIEWQAIVLGVSVSVVAAIGVAAVGLAAFLTFREAAPWALATIAVAACLGAAVATPERRAWSGAGIVYAGSLVVAVLILRNAAHAGLLAVLWLCAVAWGHDIAAYFGGRLIGGPKLWPRVSPSKTWAGTLTGIVVGGLAGAVVAVNVIPWFSVWTLSIDIGLGLLGAIAVQAGDLFESGFKRRFGVKDSGHLIPGHGGFMDRLDGFLAVAVLAAVVGVGRGGWQSAADGLFHW